MARTDKDRGLIDELPVDRLMTEALGLGQALAKHGLDRLGGGLDAVTGKLGDAAQQGPGVKDVAKGAGKRVKDVHPVKGGADLVKGGVKGGAGAVKGGAGAVTGGTKAAASKVKDSMSGAVDAVTPSGDKTKNSKNKKNANGDPKVTNIVESVDVPVPREIAYQEWTKFEEFPTFMKKVENVSQEDDDVVTWKAQVFWSHRTWKAKIIDQVPPERIVWKSEAKKGHVDGAVTFHELAPDLTRVLVTLEYHPQGLFEHTGNLWRAQGRRVRLELKHFRRHVANSTLLHQDDVEGWTGEIHDGEVKETPAKNTAAKKAPAKKTAAKKAPAKKTTAKKAPAKKTTTEKAPAKKTTAKKAPAKKTAASRTSTTRKTTTKRAPAKKTTAKKAPAKKSTAKRSTSSPRKRQTARSGS